MLNTPFLVVCGKVQDVPILQQVKLVVPPLPYTNVLPGQGSEKAFTKSLYRLSPTLVTYFLS